MEFIDSLNLAVSGPALVGLIISEGFSLLKSKKSNGILDFIINVVEAIRNSGADVGRK
jgi:hypothetical protein